ncbi:MAG: hypothetical protein HY078_00430 [Elusimicrobia bacterium]|nr:hypothetical protein [Elusimicrobiota bacterium]
MSEIAVLTERLQPTRARRKHPRVRRWGSALVLVLAAGVYLSFFRSASAPASSGASTPTPTLRIRPAEGQLVAITTDPQGATVLQFQQRDARFNLVIEKAASIP